MMAKAPKLPTYQEAIKLSKQTNKKKNTELLTKDEWEKIYKLEKEKEREKGRLKDKNRERGITIAFRVLHEERDKIYKRIALSGKKVREFMRDSTLEAPIKVVATRKVITECKKELEIIGEELKRLNQNDTISKDTLYNLDLVLNILVSIENENKKKTSSQ